MKSTPIIFAQIVTLVALVVLNAVEALRPGTIGSAINLSWLIIVGLIILAIKKSPAKTSSGD